MKRIWLSTIALTALAIPATVLALGSGGSFDGVVSSIEHRYNVRATHIPFLGVVSFFSKRATHGAVGSIHVAEFESFSQQVDGNELNALVEQKLGSGWERMIRETNRNSNQQTLIFTHPEGDRMGLFVVDLDGSEMNVVEVSVDPQHLQDSLGQYRHHHDDTANSNHSTTDSAHNQSDTE